MQKQTLKLLLFALIIILLFNIIRTSKNNNRLNRIAYHYVSIELNYLLKRYLTLPYHLFTLSNARKGGNSFPSILFKVTYVNKFHNTKYK